VTSIATVPIGILISVVLARRLGAEDYGSYSVLQHATGVAVLILAFGWPSSVVYQIRRFARSPRSAVSSSLVVCLVVSLVGAVPLLFFEDHILATILPGVTSETYRLGLAIIPAQLIGRSFVAVARGCDRFAIANGYQLGVGIVTLGLLLAVITTSTLEITAAVEIWVVANVLASLALVVAVIRTTGIGSVLSRRDMRFSVRYGVMSYAQSLAGQLHEQVDVLMLAVLLEDTSQIGIYAIAVGIVNRLKILPSSITAALFPQLSSLEGEFAISLSAKSSRGSFVATLVISVLIGGAAFVFIPFLYGEEFRNAILPLAVLLPAMCMLSTYNILARYFMSINRQRVNFASQASSLLFNLVLNLILIPRIGILGAAIASLLSYGLEFVLISTAFRRETGTPIKELLIVRRSEIEDILARISRLKGRK
jgi:O-antigen/teichoic acid export membrane protein